MTEINICPHNNTVSAQGLLYNPCAVAGYWAFIWAVLNDIKVSECLRKAVEAVLRDSPDT